MVSPIANPLVSALSVMPPATLSTTLALASPAAADAAIAVVDRAFAAITPENPPSRTLADILGRHVRNDGSSTPLNETREAARRALGEHAVAVGEVLRAYQRQLVETDPSWALEVGALALDSTNRTVPPTADGESIQLKEIDIIVRKALQTNDGRQLRQAVEELKFRWARSVLNNDAGRLQDLVRCMRDIVTFTRFLSGGESRSVCECRQLIKAMSRFGMVLLNSAASNFVQPSSRLFSVSSNDLYTAARKAIDAEEAARIALPFDADESPQTLTALARLADVVEAFEWRVARAVWVHDTEVLRELNGVLREAVDYSRDVSSHFATSFSENLSYMGTLIDLVDALRSSDPASLYAEIRSIPSGKDVIRSLHNSALQESGEIAAKLGMSDADYLTTLQLLANAGFILKVAPRYHRLTGRGFAALMLIHSDDIFSIIASIKKAMHGTSFRR